ncbi:OmpA family protein [Hanstruepera ponticola]|uniref:OmpA family protein n=1 Tax=Hanstruepera ponticola TaxID=2042995 RepID=UPI001E586DB2|nr:OmpA family protein [Hanstruepera ponticola]
MINHQDSFRLMKRGIIIIILLCIAQSHFGQAKKLKQANRLFENKAFVEAASLYQELEPNQEVLSNLGDSYYYNFQLKEAKVAYNELFNSYKDSLNKEIYFRYAHTLKGLNQYEEADKILSEYLNYEVNTKAFIEKLSRTVPYDYTIKSVNSGSSAGDFGVSYLGNEVVFASLRNSKSPSYKWNEKPYLDLYKASVSNDISFDNVIPFSEEINTDTHESNATFTTDGKTMYFSRTHNKQVKIGESKYAVVKIYRAELVDDIWTNIEVLPFTDDSYSTQHPFLDEKNNRLYFASDMPGSFGSFDIFYVDVNGDSYGEPVNLGETINTKHREQFPFVSKDNVLYFASNGHQGLGGLDIYMTHLKEEGHSTPMNLGSTINSGMDDFSFVLKGSFEKGYFSSNRDGIDKIYAFQREENKRTYLVEGEVRDKNTKAILPGTKITLLNEDGSIAGETYVGEDGKYVFETEPNKKYKIEGYRDFYIPTTEAFNTSDEGKIELNIELEIESYDDAEEIVVTKVDGYIYIELENIYFDLDKWDIKPQAAKTLDVLVDLLKKYPRMEIQLGAHTDSRSSEAYNLKLSNNRARATLEYLVSNGIDSKRLLSKGFGESQPLVNCSDNCTEDEHAINRRCEFIILK